MDFQPKFKTQTTSSAFRDGRAMRPPVEGTVGRGQLREDDRFYRGIEPDPGQPEAVSVAISTGQAPVPTPAAPPEDVPPAGPEPNWTKTLPVPVTEALMKRGQQRYNIYCATCHGRAGDGDGPVSVRSLALQQGTWLPPTSIHADHVLQQPDGQLFHTISNGIRKMPGYADQISPEDRWAIVLYLRALQRARNATLSDLPAEEAAQLRELN
jgi:mono/diheme cytochrome c family protein